MFHYLPILVIVPSKIGTAAAQRLRCCATNRKFVVSIPADVNGNFIDIILAIALWPLFDSPSNKNVHMEYFLVANTVGT